MIKFKEKLSNLHQPHHISNGTFYLWWGSQRVQLYILYENCSMVESLTRWPQCGVCWVCLGTHMCPIRHAILLNHTGHMTTLLGILLTQPLFPIAAQKLLNKFCVVCFLYLCIRYLILYDFDLFSSHASQMALPKLKCGWCHGSWRGLLNWPDESQKEPKIIENEHKNKEKNPLCKQVWIYNECEWHKRV